MSGMTVSPDYGVGSSFNPSAISPYAGTGSPIGTMTSPTSLNQQTLSGYSGQPYPNYSATSDPTMGGLYPQYSYTPQQTGLGSYDPTQGNNAADQYYMNMYNQLMGYGNQTPNVAFSSDPMMSPPPPPPAAAAPTAISSQITPEMAAVYQGGGFGQLTPTEQSSIQNMAQAGSGVGSNMANMTNDQTLAMMMMQSNGGGGSQMAPQYSNELNSIAQSGMAPYNGSAQAMPSNVGAIGQGNNYSSQYGYYGPQAPSNMIQQPYSSFSDQGGR